MQPAPPWAEQLIVGPEAVDPYGRVYAPLVTLGWKVRIGLGTSIVLVPLHHPMHLAKEVATSQELSGGRFTLGVGMGWHRDEYDFIVIPFEGRGRRGDEAIRLMRALGSSECDFKGVLVVPRRDLGAGIRRRSRRSGSAAARNLRSGGLSSWVMCGIRRAARTRSTFAVSRSSILSCA